MKKIYIKKIVAESLLEAPEDFTNSLMQHVSFLNKDVIYFKRRIVVLFVSVIAVFMVSMLYLINTEISINYFDVAIPSFVLQLMGIIMFFICIFKIIEFARTVRILSSIQNSIK